MVKFQIGDEVQWTCKPFTDKPFVCKGLIRGFKVSTFGGKKKGKGASIEVSTKKYHNRFKKKIAFVSLDKLILIN